MLAAIERKELDILLLYSQSRLGRDSVEVERAIRRLEFHGMRLVTCEGYDTQAMSPKMRKMTRGLKGLMDEAYLDDLKELTHRGLTDQALKKFWCGGKPYGYRLVEVTDPTRKDIYGRPARIGSNLVVDKTQAKSSWKFSRGTRKGPARNQLRRT